MLGTHIARRAVDLQNRGPVRRLQAEGDVDPPLVGHEVHELSNLEVYFIAIPLTSLQLCLDRVLGFQLAHLVSKVDLCAHLCAHWLHLLGLRDRDRPDRPAAPKSEHNDSQQTGQPQQGP